MIRKTLTSCCIIIAAAIMLQLAVPAQAHRIRYEYDSLDRLTKVIHPNGETVFYTYDEVGNRILKVASVNPAPTLVSLSIANGQTQRSTVNSISAQFSKNVNITVDSLSIRGLSHGLINLSDATFDYNPGTFTATWMLPYSLPDDNYFATLDSDKITDVVGKNLDGNGDGIGGDDAIFQFHRLFGDATGDAIVNTDDLSLFISRWLNTPSDTGLDFNLDGIINFSDFAYFAKNWSGYIETEPKKGDFNTNGIVDLQDLAIFASHWLDTGCTQPSWCGGTDIDHNTKVDFSDFALFAQHWLEGI